MAKRIGLVPMAAKPYHAGHDGLVRIAASQCDVVHLFVSLSDRVRPGELPILGSSMKVLWEKYIEPSLPSNVVVTYGGSPVGNLYSMLGEADKNRSGDTYVIYSDAEDILKYTDKSLSTYAPFLFEKNRIKLEGVDRSQTVNVSGTKMRAALSSGNARLFAMNLPTALQPRAQEIIELLSGPGVENKPKGRTRKVSTEGVEPDTLKSRYYEAMVRKTVRDILKEDVADPESPYGVSFPGSKNKDLISILSTPFLVGMAGLKDVGTRVVSLIEIGVKTILSTIIPGLRFKYDKIFAKEEKRLEEIKKQYSKVYERVDNTMKTSDFPLFAFMVSPALFMGYKGTTGVAKMGKKTSLDLLSAISGGYSDKLVEGAKEKYADFEEWMLRGTEFGSEAERRKRERRRERKRKFRGINKNESLASRYAAMLLEKDEEVGASPEEEKEKKYQEILRNIFEKSLASDAAKEMQSSARKAYMESLDELYEQAESVLKKLNKIEDVEKFFGENMNQETKAQIDKIKELEPQEKQAAEENLIKGVRESAKEFYVKDLGNKIEKAKSQGIPEESQYIRDYKEKLEAIKQL